MSSRARNAFAVFSGIAGSAGLVVQLLTAPGPMRTAAFGVLLGSAAALGALVVLPELLRLRRSKQSLPSDAELDSLATRYVVEQASSSDISWIAKLEADVYSPEDAIPEMVLREWYSANPTGFSVIKTLDGRRVGHLDILPLRPRSCEAIVAGDIVEREIRGDSLYGPDERDEITCLYVESIALCLPKPLSNTVAITAILASLPEVMNRVGELNRIEHLYAIAASTAGERLMRRLGFDVLRPGDRRKDKHDFFVARASVVATRARALCRLTPA